VAWAWAGLRQPRFPRASQLQRRVSAAVPTTV